MLNSFERSRPRAQEAAGAASQGDALVILNSTLGNTGADANSYIIFDEVAFDSGDGILELVPTVLDPSHPENNVPNSTIRNVSGHDVLVDLAVTYINFVDGGSIYGPGPVLDIGSNSIGVQLVTYSPTDFADPAPTKIYRFILKPYAGGSTMDYRSDMFFSGDAVRETQIIITARPLI